MLDRRGRRARPLLPLIGDAGLTTVVTTHQHWDHHRALADVVAATGAEVGRRRAGRRRDHRADRRRRSTRRVGDGDTVAVGVCTLEVIALAGHTPGSIALLYDDPRARRAPAPLHRRLAVPGGSWSATRPEDFASLMDDLEAKVFAPLPDDTWFYPGHGDDSTLGAERAAIAEWRARRW